MSSSSVLRRAAVSTIFFIAVAVAAANYLSTTHASVGGGDAGELMCVAHTLATAHPPGYPLFTLATHFGARGVRWWLLEATKVVWLPFITIWPTTSSQQNSSVEGGQDDATVPAAEAAYHQNLFHTWVSVGATVVLFAAVYRFCLFNASEESGLQSRDAPRCASAALLAVLVFAFSPTVWSYAVHTEVFALNNALTAWLLLLVVNHARYYRALQRASSSDRIGAARRLRRHLYFCAFASGLALTNQHTTVLFIAPYAIWAVGLTWWGGRCCCAGRAPSAANMGREGMLDGAGSIVVLVKLLAVASFYFVVGLLPYLFLPWSSHVVNDDTNAWGELATWEGFLAHVLRAEYGTFSLASKEATYRKSDFIKTWSYYLSDVVDQTSNFGWALALLALLVWTKHTALARWHSPSTKVSMTTSSKAPPPSAVRGGTSPAAMTDLREDGSEKGCLWSDPALPLLASWILYTCFFHYLCNLPIEQPLFFGVQQRFWIQPLMVMSMWIGRGFCVCVDVIADRATTTIIYRRAGPKGTSARQEIVVGLLSFVAAMSLSQWHIASNYNAHDDSHNHFVRDFGRSLLAPLPHHSILLTKGDVMINSARAVQTLEGFRPDVAILDQELLTYDWYNHKARRRYAPPQHPRDGGDFPEKQKQRISFPGSYYYPGRAGSYDLKQFLIANLKGAEVFLKSHPQLVSSALPPSERRRVFVAVGTKEGDESHKHLFTRRQFGLAEEIVVRRDWESVLPAESPDRPPKAAIVAQLAQYSAELQRSVPPHLRLPPIGKYPVSSWEQVVQNDAMHSWILVAFQLTRIGEAIVKTQADGSPNPYVDRRTAGLDVDTLTWGEPRPQGRGKGGQFACPSRVGPTDRRSAVDVTFYNVTAVHWQLAKATCLTRVIDYLREGEAAARTSASAVATIYCGVALADALYVAVRGCFDGRLTIPSHVLRNRAVTLQTLLQWQPADKAILLREIRDSLTGYLHDADEEWKRGRAAANGESGWGNAAAPLPSASPEMDPIRRAVEYYSATAAETAPT